jgi:hypothetical protein
MTYPKYRIKHPMGHFGYCREGGGRVLYLFNSEWDGQTETAIQQVVDYVYTDTYQYEDGKIEIDWAEYSPAEISLGDMEFMDDMSMEEVVEQFQNDDEDGIDEYGEYDEDDVRNEDDVRTFFSFLTGVMDQGTFIVYINHKSKSIVHVPNKEYITRYIELDKGNWNICITNYDHIYDY